MPNSDQIVIWVCIIFFTSPIWVHALCFILERLHIIGPKIPGADRPTGSTNWRDIAIYSAVQNRLDRYDDPYDG